MFKLTKTQRQVLGELQTAYEQAKDDFSQALADLAGDMRAAWEDRSERWQDSDAGQEAVGVCDILDDLVDRLDDTVTLEEIP